VADSAIIFTPGEVSRYFAVRVPNLKQRGADELRGPCLIHKGKGDNFSVNKIREPAGGGRSAR